MIFAVIATLLSSIVSLLLASVIVFRDQLRHRYSLELSSLAAGVLLATATLHLLPESVEEGLSVENMGLAVLTSIVVFFLLERLVLWVHHHHEIEGPRPSAWLVTFGDGLHNLLDGFAIATSFLVDPMLGVFTTIAIAAHELPSEIADFVILLQSGLAPKKALAWNALSALMAFVGLFLGWFAAENFTETIPFVLAASGGMFLYIALSDIIPELHSHENARQWTQIAFFLGGLFLVHVMNTFLHV